MSSKKKKPVIFGGSKACVFCNTEEDDELMFGKFIHMKTFSVHHNCMFFSSGLAQRSKKTSTGLLGFTIEDLKKEVLRGRKLRCFYCKDAGATVGCCVGSCRKTFHFPCGKKNSSLHQFFGSFNSYCESHKPQQQHITTPRDVFRCHVCFSFLSRTAIEDCLYSTCCKNNWYHVTCLQQYAISAGRHFFKCPKCKNSSEFIKEMEYYGICIPEKDASWELEENAYQDLLFRPECAAPTCKCDQGRKYNKESMWELLYCKLCGSNARHRFCESLGSTVESWTCPECKILDDQFEINKFKTQINLEVTTQNKFPTGNTASNCEPSCSSFDSTSSVDPWFTSTSILKRALQCVVQISPVKTVTDVNGIIKPVWQKKYQYDISKQSTPVKIVSKTNEMHKTVMEKKMVTPVKIVRDTIRMSKTVLPKNDENKEEKQNITELSTVTNQINKLQFEEVNENLKRETDLGSVSNKKARLQEKVMNTVSNEVLRKKSKSQLKKSSVKANTSHAKKNKSCAKLTKCCSNETCISKFFGLECPKLKNNRFS